MKRAGLLAALWCTVLAVVLLAMASGLSVYMATVAAVFSYAVTASGLGYSFGQAGMLSMAQAGLWGIGAYTAAYAAVEWHWSFLPACLAAIVLSSLAGLLVAVPALRVKGHYFLIITFIITLLLVTIAGNLTPLTGGVQGRIVTDMPGVGSWRATTTEQLLVLYAVLYALAATALAGIKLSRLGRLTVMVRENEALAAAVGVDVARLKFATFAISGAFAGLGGAMYLYFVQAIAPELFGLGAATVLAATVIVGGPRFTLGPLFGALLLQLLPLWLGFSPNVSSGVNGALLIAIIVLAGGGLVGTAVTLAKRARAPRPAVFE